MSKSFNKADNDADDFMMNLYRGGSAKPDVPSVQLAPSVRCFHSHPPIPLGNGVLYGGNCQTPSVKGCDVYIALDGYTSTRHTVFPWDEPSKIIEFAYPITDMAAPRDSVSFKKMITWVCNQLHNGAKVHVGCMGGHGRTGTVLAAVVREMTGNKNAIKWVRENYCDRAVESSEQVRFLHHHFDIEKVSGAKEHNRSSGFGFSSGMNWKPADVKASTGGHPKQRSLFKPTTVLGNPTGAFAGAVKTFKSVTSNRLIW